MIVESGLRVVIPGRPPSLNHSYKRDRKTARVILTAEAKAWKRTVYYVTLDALNRSGWKPGPGMIVVCVWLYLAVGMDADNGLKGLLDSVAEAIGVNDRVFLPRVMGKEVGIADERVELYLVNEP